MQQIKTSVGKYQPQARLLQRVYFAGQGFQ
jgi:hypothetical protein